MDPTLENFKSKLKDQKLPSDGFDVEGLWDSVSDDLDRLQFTDSKRKKRSYLFFILCFILGTSGLYFITNTNARNGQNLFEGHTTAKKMRPIHSKRNLDNTLSSEKIESLQNKRVQGLAHDIQLANNESNNKISESNKSNSILKSSPHKKSKATTSLKSADKHYFNSDLSYQIPATKSSNARTTFTEQESIETTIIKNIPYRLSLSGEHQIQNLKLPLPLPLTALGDSEKLKTKSHLVGIWTGVNLTSSHYPSQENPSISKLREETESAQLGNSHGFSYQLITNDKWIFRSGIEGHFFSSKFQYTEESTILEKKSNQLLKVWIDAETGVELKREYGDTTVEVTSTRKVRHYNKFYSIRIPFEVGLRRSANNFLYGILAGAVFNYTPFQSGKTIGLDKEILHFQGKDSQALLAKFSLGARISPFIGWKVNNSLNFKIFPQWTWHRGNYSSNGNIKSNVHMFNFNFGITHTLGKSI